MVEKLIGFDGGFDGLILDILLFRGVEGVTMMEGFGMAFRDRWIACEPRRSSDRVQKTSTVEAPQHGLHLSYHMEQPGFSSRSEPVWAYPQ